MTIKTSEATPQLQPVDPKTLSATELLLFQKFHPELLLSENDNSKAPDLQKDTQ